MRVALLISRAAHQGGLQKYARKTARAFAARGCDVTVLTLGSVPEAMDTGVKFLSLGSPSPLSLLTLWHYDRACQAFLRDHSMDIVFGIDRTRYQTHLRAGNGVHAAYLKQRLLVDSSFKALSLSFNPLHRSILYFERVAFENPNLKVLFTNSGMVRNEILSLYKTDPTKITVVHNGVEWQDWQTPFDEWPKHKIDTRYTFLFVGHGYQRKGLEFLLRGFARLTNKDTRLFIVGKDRNPLKFQKSAEQLGLKGRVEFYGPQSAILPFYQQADALVIPSLYDPFANVTVEALAMGLFVVSSSYNGGCEVLTPTTGTVIESLTDPDSVAAALNQALLHPKTVSSALEVRNSVSHLDFSHQLDTMVDRTLN